MAETTIGINIKGNDQASQTIRKVANELGSLGNKAKQGGLGGLGKLMDSGVKMATKSLGQLGGALSSLGPIGIATGALLAGAIKRYNYEVEQNINAIKDQEQALRSMADAAQLANSHIEKRLKLEQRLRDLQDEIDGADSVGRAVTKVENLDSEIEAVRKQIDELDGVRKTSQKLANQFTESVETVRAGHAVWWETGTEKANKANLEAAEKARETAKKAAEEQYALNLRLVELEKEREAAVAAVARAEEQVTEEKKKQEEQDRKKTNADLLKSLRNERSALQKQLREMTALASPLKLSGLNQANSHATNLLIDRLNGAGADNTTQEISTNVKTMTDRLIDIDEQIGKLQEV